LSTFAAGAAASSEKFRASVELHLSALHSGQLPFFTRRDKSIAIRLIPTLQTPRAKEFLAADEKLLCNKKLRLM